MGEEEHKDSAQTEAGLDDSTRELLDEDTNNPHTEADTSDADGSSLQAELENALATADKYRDEALRAMAELDNVRKRAEKDVESAHKFGLEKFITELLPVKDSMDLGFDAANSATDVEALREGMALTLKMFEDALEKRGVNEINPIGESFDPEFHQAMMMEESVEVEAGKILRVMQKGYLLNDRLIRPAMVVVAKSASQD
ncbi:MAG: nucleotide exchange factor GrpE [Gammaproteobacteria bacterium]